MKKLTTIVTMLGLSLLTNVATADGKDNWSKSQARLAEKLQLRDTYLPRRYQTANVFDAMLGPGIRHGAAWLIRSKNGISGRIMSNVPTAGDPYTLWVIVFNNPDACASVCGEDDLGNPAVKFSIFNGTGAISAANGDGGGVVNMDFSIVAGNLANDQFVLLGDGDGLRRNRGFKAQVVLIIDNHPLFVPGGDNSWITDLTETNLRGDGSAMNIRTAVFVPCPDTSCPDSLL